MINCKRDKLEANFFGSSGRNNKLFKGLTIQSTINNSTYYDSEEDDAESDPNNDPRVATHINNGNSPHKLLIGRIIPDIIPEIIPAAIF